MSCNDDGPLSIEREVELPGSPDEVWEALPDVIDDGSHVPASTTSVDPPRRWTFFWAPAEGDDAPSYVEIKLDAHGDGTLIHIDETRLDACPRSLRTPSSMPARLVDRVFDALADPTRRRIVERLGRAPATAGELAGRSSGHVVRPSSSISRCSKTRTWPWASATAGASCSLDARRRSSTPPHWMHDVGAAWDRRLEQLKIRLNRRR